MIGSILHEYCDQSDRQSAAPVTTAGSVVPSLCGRKTFPDHVAVCSITFKSGNNTVIARPLSQDFGNLILTTLLCCCACTFPAKVLRTSRGRRRHMATSTYMCEVRANTKTRTNRRNDVILQNYYALLLHRRFGQTLTSDNEDAATVLLLKSVSS